MSPAPVTLPQWASKAGRTLRVVELPRLSVLPALPVNTKTIHIMKKLNVYPQICTSSMMTF